MWYLLLQVITNVLKCFQDEIGRKEYFHDWVDCSKYTSKVITMAKMELLTDSTGGRDTLLKVFTITIMEDGRYQLFALGRKVELLGTPLPDVLTTENMGILSEVLSKATLCLGLSRPDYVLYLQRRKGFIKRKGITSAYLDCTFEGGCRDPSYPQGTTVRSFKCSMLVHGDKKICAYCTRYRENSSNNGKPAYSRWSWLFMHASIFMIHNVSLHYYFTQVWHT